MNIIRNCWFPNGSKYESFWFSSNYSNEKNKDITEVINIIENMYTITDESLWKQNSDMCFNGIILFDQLYRHVNKNTVMHDKIALDLVFYAIKNNWIPKEPHHIVFFLLPFRHTKKNIPYIFSTRLIKLKIKSSTDAHYKRFIKAAIKNPPIYFDLLEYDAYWLNWIDSYRDILCDKINYSYHKNSYWIYDSLAWKIFINFIDEKKNIKEDKSVIVSLSGGVDSMVFLHLCQIYKKTVCSKFNFYAVHINWKQRDESDREALFLENFMKSNNIPYFIKEFNDVNKVLDRNKFEKEGKIFRFNIYRNLLDHCNANCVFLGHHKGDMIENTLTNIIQGTNFLDLGKIRDYSVIDKVPIVRPFLNIDKKHIYEVAINNLVPFFKDTTPKTSNRGFLRREIIPIINSKFNNQFEKGILNTAKRSRELGTLINSLIEDTYITKLNMIDNKIFIPFDKNKPVLFYELIFEKIFYKNNLPKIRNKALLSWYNNAIQDNTNSYTLSKSVQLKIKENNIIISINN